MSKALDHKPHQPNHNELRAPRSLGINMDRVASQHAGALDAAVAQTAIAETVICEMDAVIRGEAREKLTLPEGLRGGLNGQDLETAAIPENLSQKEFTVANRIAAASLKHWRPASR